MQRVVFLLLYKIYTIISCSQVGLAEGAGQRLITELLTVVDYSTYETWYNRTLPTATHAQRDTEASNNIKQYVATLIYSTNNVYKTLEKYDIRITIKLIKVLIMKTAKDAPWIETIKQPQNDTYKVDPDKVIAMFKNKSIELGATIPHDHAMTLTQYNLEIANGSRYAGMESVSECYDRSVSVVKVSDGFHSAVTMAHELGHSFACPHDGQGNACPSEGYVMAPGASLDEREWIFSSCSATYIKDFIAFREKHHNNCLKIVDNTHPDAHLGPASHEWFGQVYSFDEQCKIIYGPESSFCRSQYFENYDEVCQKFDCINTKITDEDAGNCYYIDGAGDGTPCGTGKWCMSGRCVKSNTPSLQNVTDWCPAGEEPGVIANGKTCAQIRINYDGECGQYEVKEKCCEACRYLQSLVNTSNVDEQCEFMWGKGSYACRASAAYDGKAYSDVVCEDLRCHPHGNETRCYSSVALDGAPCGNHKWCKNSTCVYDNSAPAVRDNCPWGDEPGIATHGLTCRQLKQATNHWRCFSPYVSKKCCDSCRSILQSVTALSSTDIDGQCALKHGNGSKLCRATSAYKNKSYSDILCSDMYCSVIHEDDLCISTVAVNKTACGHNKWCIDGVCVHDDSAPSVSDDCPWGDANGVITSGLTCSDLSKPRNHHYCLSSRFVARYCCDTCAALQKNASALSSTDADGQCKLKYGGGSYVCRTTSAYVGKSYSDVVCSDLYCYDPAHNWCASSTAEDKTSCGYKKWCINGACVHDGSAPAVSDDCPWSDSVRTFSGGLTCDQIMKTENRFHCFSGSIPKYCCDTCSAILQNATKLSSTDIDGQCDLKHGNGSTFCRASSAYSGKQYSDLVCSSMYCNTGGNMCTRSGAVNKTTCGNKKWCIEGSCVHDDAAPTVPDNCPYGDEPGVVSSGLTCQQIRQHDHNIKCYSSYVSKVCCETCAAIHRNVKGCEYGDKYTGCQRHSCSRYEADVRAGCCDTCKDVSIIG